MHRYQIISDDLISIDQNLIFLSRYIFVMKDNLDLNSYLLKFTLQVTGYSTCIVLWGVRYCEVWGVVDVRTVGCSVEVRPVWCVDWGRPEAWRLSGGSSLLPPSSCPILNILSLSKSESDLCQLHLTLYQIWQLFTFYLINCFCFTEYPEYLFMCLIRKVIFFYFISFYEENEAK